MATTPYTIRSTSRVSVCSPYTSYFGLCRDSATTLAQSENWESFTSESLKPYFENGMAMFSDKLAELKDLNLPYSDQQAREILFMLDALVQARLSLSSLV